jgi:hypothetical protein
MEKMGRAVVQLGRTLVLHTRCYGFKSHQLHFVVRGSLIGRTLVFDIKNVGSIPTL